MAYDNIGISQPMEITRTDHSYANYLYIFYYSIGVHVANGDECQEIWVAY